MMDVDPKADVASTVSRVLSSMNPGDGGIIAVDHAGQITMQFTTGGMFRGTMRQGDSDATIAIWND